MKKLTQEQRKEFDGYENDYFVARSQIKGMYAFWKRVGIAGIIVGSVGIVVGIGAAIYAMDKTLDMKENVKLVVLRADEKGNLFALRDLADPQAINREDATKSFLGMYVQALYSVPNSIEMRQENAYRVKYMTKKDYYAKVPQKMLQAAYSLANPSTNVITVTVTATSRINASVWQVDWTKKQNSEVIGKFRTWITYTTTTVGDVQIAYYNPLGLVVTNIDTQADLQ